MRTIEMTLILIVGSTTLALSDEIAADSPIKFTSLTYLNKQALADNPENLQLKYQPNGDGTHPPIYSTEPMWWSVRLPAVTAELHPGTYRIQDWKQFNTIFGQDHWVLVEHTERTGADINAATLPHGWLKLPHTPGGALLDGIALLIHHDIQSHSGDGHDQTETSPEQRQEP